MDSLKHRVEDLENALKDKKHRNYEEEFSKMSPEERNAYLFKLLRESPKDPELEKMTTEEKHQRLMDMLRRPNDDR